MYASVISTSSMNTVSFAASSTWPVFLTTCCLCHNNQTVLSKLLHVHAALLPLLPAASLFLMIMH